MCIPTCIHPSIHPSIYTYIRVSYFRFCAKRRGIVPNVRSSTRFPHFFVWKRYRILSRESGIILSFVERRSFPVRIQCFTMCFVPVGIMKRVDAASSRRVVLSSRCSKERLKRRFRKVGSGFEVRDTGLVVSSERKRQLFQRAKLSYRERNTRRIPSRFVSLALQPYSRQRSRATLEERENGRHSQSSFSHVYVTLRSERKKEKNQDVRTSYMIKY